MSISPPPYDIAKAFMASWRSAVARGHLASGGLVKASRCGELLLVSVLYMPDAAFDPRFLENGPGPGVSVFSALGDAWWLETFALAVAAAQGADQRDGMAAIVLLPSAVDAARERLPQVA